MVQRATMAPMTTTPPDLSGWKRAIRARGIDPDALPPRDREPAGESADDLAERLSIQASNRSSRWRAALPPMYASASMDDLTADQVQVIQEWIERGGVNLILAGSVGTGKTHAAYAVGHRMVARNEWVEAWAVVDLLDALKPGRNANAEHNARECDVLILDDFGADRATEWAQERILALIDARVRGEKRTVITTNATGDQLTEAWGARLSDRLAYARRVIVFAGESRRKGAW